MKGIRQRKDRRKRRKGKKYGIFCRKEEKDKVEEIKARIGRNVENKDRSVSKEGEKKVKKQNYSLTRLVRKKEIREMKEREEIIRKGRKERKFLEKVKKESFEFWIDSFKGRKERLSIKEDRK